MEYGYARVSTKEQNEERQLIALRAAGLHNHQIFLDKQSGKDFNRCQYQRLLRRLKRGDTLIIKSIDRLGRKPLSWFWTCRCWTRIKTEISLVH